LRTARPTLLLAPHVRDVHPTTRPQPSSPSARSSSRVCVTTSRSSARRIAPRLFLRYPGNQPVEPNLVVDISAVASAKADVVRCYRSQLNLADRAHLVQDWTCSSGRSARPFHGARIGVRAAKHSGTTDRCPCAICGCLLGLNRRADLAQHARPSDLR
jgi:LmbE family N-acetylglucosaminyl deacetylase